MIDMEDELAVVAAACPIVEKVLLMIDPYTNGSFNNLSTMIVHVATIALASCLTEPTQGTHLECDDESIEKLTNGFRDFLSLHISNQRKMNEMRNRGEL